MLLSPALILYPRTSHLSLFRKAPSSEKKVLLPRLSSIWFRTISSPGQYQLHPEKFKGTKSKDDKRGRKETQKKRVGTEEGRKWEKKL